MNWVCTESNNDNEMFQKLYQYIAGSNSANENIDMTTPVSTKWHKGELHEECFYLNNEHQANPPKPNSPDVYIVTRPAMIIYTRYVLSYLFVLFYEFNITELFYREKYLRHLKFLVSHQKFSCNQSKSTNISFDGIFQKSLIIFLDSLKYSHLIFRALSNFNLNIRLFFICMNFSELSPNTSGIK